MSEKNLDELLAGIAASPKNWRSQKLISALERLGFKTKKRESGNHTTVIHPNIPGLYFNFDAGHGGNALIKPCYIKNIRVVLDRFEDQLRSHLGGKK